MAGTVTATYRKSTSVRVVDVEWTSDASGDATGKVALDGQLIKVVTNPSATAPTDNYDITLVDEDSIDVAGGLLANRDTTNSEEVYLFKQVTLTGTGSDAAAVPIYHGGLVTFTVAAAGNAKSGVARIYLR